MKSFGELEINTGEAVMTFIRVLSQIRLEGLRKIIKNFSQYCRSSFRDLNQVPPKYKLEELPYESLHGVVLS